MHPTSDESVECVPGSLGSGKDRKDTESSEELERDGKFIHFTSLSMKNVRMKNIAVNKKVLDTTKLLQLVSFVYMYIHAWCYMCTMISNFYRVRQVIIPRPTSLGELIAHVYLTY